MAPDDPAPTDDGHLDVAREQERLEQLRKDTEAVAREAMDDLAPGGPGRTFVDSGVRSQVEEEGDTDHPLADR